MALNTASYFCQCYCVSQMMLIMTLVAVGY